MIKKPIKIFLVVISTLIFLGITLFVAIAVLSDKLDMPTGTLSSEGIIFKVSQGDTGQAIARKLEESGIIRSRSFFLYLIRIKNYSSSLKSGEYLIKQDMSSSDILDLLTSGKQVLKKLTIAEGLTTSQIAHLAEDNGIASYDDVISAINNKEICEKYGISSASGFLFPDTYMLPKNISGKKLVEIMVSNFFTKLYSAVPESENLSKSDLIKNVIIASIVEREYRIPEEAPKMASVFWNRTKINMRLQSCATVVYVITERQGKAHPSRIFDRDLEIDDPFNTYKYNGLPPEPICNPGLTSLKATIKPEKSDNLYFRLINAETGEHHFSKTLNEHISAEAFIVKPINK